MPISQGWREELAEDWAKRDELYGRFLNRIPTGWFVDVSVGRGWLPLITELDEQLAKLDAHYEIHQIKEKFGGLRYYARLSDYNNRTNNEREEFNRLISAAESKSHFICERCGAEGELCSGTWIKTLCKQHQLTEERTPFDDEQKGYFGVPGYAYPHFD